jgi:hypothetical protein
MDRLRSLVSDPKFAQLEPAYLTTTSMTRDGAHPPSILRDVLSILNEILATSTRR